MSNAERISMQQMSDQARAGAAWRALDQVAKEIENEYGSLARRLPALLQTNGLGQTLAFLRSKDKQHFKLIYQHLSVWVLVHVGGQGSGDLLEWIIGTSSNHYRRAAVEAAAYALWLRRFAEARGWNSTTEED